MTRRPTDPTQPPVYGTHHTAYRCRDAEETREFYEDLLGLPLAQALDIEGHPTTGEQVRYMHLFFDMGSHDTEAPTYIAFFEVNGGDYDFDFKTQWGMDLHFAMGVSDHEALDVWQKRLEGRGVVVEGPIDHGICSSIYFHDPNGYRLEFATENAKQKGEFEQGRQQAHEIIERWTKSKAVAAS
jgi:catechol 2,3-dioxygenase-like lactoylglutathione lyase family enzyme